MKQLLISSIGILAVVLTAGCNLSPEALMGNQPPRGSGRSYSDNPNPTTSGISCKEENIKRLAHQSECRMPERVEDVLRGYDRLGTTVTLTLNRIGELDDSSVEIKVRESFQDKVVTLPCKAHHASSREFAVVECSAPEHTSFAYQFYSLTLKSKYCSAVTIYGPGYAQSSCPYKDTQWVTPKFNGRYLF